MSGGADRAIRVSTAAAVLGVAGIAAYVSYQHAFEVVRAHGESGLTARLEPATIDGLVYSSSMVVLYAARHRLPVSGLARWLLALGIVATLAANVTHGWADGPVGAVVAAWPAASLVGSYELLLWLIRTSTASTSTGNVVLGPARCTSGPIRSPARGRYRCLMQPGPQAPARQAARRSPLLRAIPAARIGPGQPDRAGPGQPGPWTGRRPARPVDRQAPGWPADQSENEVNAAAVAAYRASLEDGRPLSERKLAHPAGDPAGSGTGARVSLAPPAMPADARGTPNTSDHDRLAARPLAP